MCPNLQFPADLVTFTKEILNEKLHFLCSENLRLLGKALWDLLVPFLESFCKEVDISYMQILQYYQKRRWVLDLGIRLTLIHERVGIDQRNGNRLVSAVFCFSL